MFLANIRFDCTNIWSQTSSSQVYFSLFVSVGPPIHVDKVTSPSDAQIEQLHTEYTEELKRLFEENRNKYGVPREAKLIIQ